MSFKSILGTIGADAKKVFAYIVSPQGQAVISTGETALETLDPALTGLFAIANVALAEVLKVEALAAAAGSATGTGAQKLTAVVSATSSEIIAFAEKNGLPTPTGATIQNAINGLVAFANALEGK